MLKDRVEAEVTLCSDSDSSDHLDKDLIPPKDERRITPSQSVNCICACYIAPVGHFHAEHEDPRRVEVQHRRSPSPRRVRKKKFIQPRPQRKTMKKRDDNRKNKKRPINSKTHKRPRRRQKGTRHKRTHQGTNQRQTHQPADLATRLNCQQDL